MRAFRYARGTYPSHLIGKTLARKSPRVPFDWYFYLARIDNACLNKGRPGDAPGILRPSSRSHTLVLIDAGFADSKLARRFGIRRFIRPDRLLRRVHIKPTRVDYIILTHAHFDHAGGIRLFPRARVILPRGAPSPRGIRKHGILRAPPGGVLAPFLSLRFSGGHTRFHQTVAFRRNGVKYILTGDECYLRSYCLNGGTLPRASVWSSARNAAYIRHLRREHGRGARVLTFHDPRQFQGAPEIARDVFSVF